MILTNGCNITKSEKSPYPLYVMCNAKMTLFEMSLLWARVGVGLGQIMSCLH